MNSETLSIKKKAKAIISKRILAKRRFLDFVTYKSPWFKINWHHEVIADALERVENGKLKRLMIFAPPRHTKSELVSIHFPPWVLGRDKNKSVIEASYSDGLASEFGRQARNIVDSEEYRKIFDTTLAEDSKSKSVWSTNGRGKYNAVGVGGSVTGKGADILIIDDPIKNRKDAESFLIRDNIHKWYQSTARTRLSPDGAIIMVVTRWHDDDLPGRVLSSEGAEDWEIISLTAIAIEDEKNRKKGEALWPGQFDLQNLLKTKVEVGPYEWASLFQQNPVNSETQEFTKSMFKYVTEHEVLRQRTTCYITIDSAVKETDDADYTGVTINRINEKNDWNIKSYRKRLNSTKLIDEIFTLWKEEKPDAIGIEDTIFFVAIQPFLQAAMIERNTYPILYPLKHGGVNKILRVRCLLPRYVAGKIFHIQGECDTLEEQLVRFPKGANDDEPDALAYQYQIAQPPVPLSTQLEDAVNSMSVDSRTGYFR